MCGFASCCLLFCPTRRQTGCLASLLTCPAAPKNISGLCGRSCTVERGHIKRGGWSSLKPNLGSRSVMCIDQGAQAISCQLGTLNAPDLQGQVPCARSTPCLACKLHLSTATFAGQGPGAVLLCSSRAVEPGSRTSPACQSAHAPLLHLLNYCAFAQPSRAATLTRGGSLQPCCGYGKGRILSATHPTSQRTLCTFRRPSSARAFRPLCAGPPRLPASGIPTGRTSARRHARALDKLYGLSQRCTHRCQASRT